MWTGLGVIFIICALAWPVVRFIITALFGSIAGATGTKQTQQKIYEAEREAEQQARLDRQRIMDADYRHQKMHEMPCSVVVGEKFEYKKVWSDIMHGWTFPFTVKYPCYYWKRKKEEYVSYDANHTKENGFTESIYEYIRNVEFVDDIEPKQWCVENRVYLGRFDVAEKNETYVREREHECDQYCEAISNLAYRYVNFNGYTEFRTAFIKVLMQNRDIALRFIEECHAANQWRIANNQIYDCDNYLQDFMRENRIKEKMDSLIGHSVTIPPDLRYYRPKTDDACAAEHIKHEQEKRGWHSDIAKNEMKSQNSSGASAIWLIALIIAVILFFANVGSMSKVVAFISVIGILIGIFIWGMTLYNSCTGQEHADKIRQAEYDEPNYNNPMIEHTNKLGKAYANELYKEIMLHPAPYKYYIPEQDALREVEAREAAPSPPPLPSQNI